MQLSRNDLARAREARRNPLGQLSRALLVVALLASPAVADRTVAITPLSTLGAEDKSTESKQLLTQIEQAIGALPGTKLVTSQAVSIAIDRAKKPQLKQCEADAACLTELGKLVGAELVVTGEVGGLGDSRVVYLKVTDVAAGRELRSTTLAVGAEQKDDSPSGAAVRLLDPDKYRGNVKFNFDVQGATVLVNGTKVQLSATKELALPVGTQAVTVTHPQYHNFVKFVDVAYGKVTPVDVNMKQYPIIEHDIQGKPVSRDSVRYIDPPWYRRPYVTGPVIVVLAITAGVITAALVHDFPSYDNCRKVGGDGSC
jgi:hypothetical protein